MNELTCSVLAASAGGGSSLAVLGAAIACGVIILGAAFGIAFIGGRAVESIARQPEAGSRIFLAMIIAGGLVEGVSFFALAICFLIVFWLH